MSEEERPKRQDETGAQRALKSVALSKKRDFQKLSGALIRVDVYITEQEQEVLSLFAASMQVEHLLECFVADLTSSGRHVWPQCGAQAQSWLKIHQEGQALIAALTSEQEGGEPC
jgi:hypothetical protein